MSARAWFAVYAGVVVYLLLVAQHTAWVQKKSAVWRRFFAVFVLMWPVTVPLGAAYHYWRKIYR